MATNKPAIQLINGHPAGMPDPELPWPWKTQMERELQASLPYWQKRFKRYPELYAKWIVKGAKA